MSTLYHTFEAFGASTYGKALAYHREVLRKLPQPYTKAMWLGSFFPEWFSLYLFMLHIDKHAACYFDKPHYTPLKLNWELNPFPHMPKLQANLVYSSSHPTHPIASSAFTTPRIDGYLITFNANEFVVIDGQDDWGDLKAECEQLFRPYVELRAPQHAQAIVKQGMSR